MKPAKKVIDIAIKEVGYLEKSKSAYIRNPAVIYYKIDGAGYDNINKYAFEIDKLDWYNGPKNGFAWCACFVDWCMIQAFGVDDAGKMKNHGIYDASCGWAVESFQNAGQFYKYPKPGDQIFFKDSDGDPCHTGIVIDVDEEYVHTVEGNTSGAEGIESNGGGVFRKKYPIGYYRIYGYGRPLYEEEEDDYMTRDEILKELGDTWISTYDDLPEWAKSDVRWMLDNEIINGGTDYNVDPNDINMFLSDIKNIIVAKRLIDAKK